MPKFGCGKTYQIKVEPRVFQCSDCGCQESVTDGTLLHRTRTPLVKWFWAAYLLSQGKRGISAMQLRELDLHDDTAWTMLHKLRWALFDKGGFPLAGLVEVDETCHGGKDGHDSRGRSLSNKNKALIAMAVERGMAKPKKMPGTNLLSHGWPAYAPAGKRFQHEPVTQAKPNNAGNVLPFVHLQFNNFKSWLNGTFHGVSPKHLPAYLQEWNYRFNRRWFILGWIRPLSARTPS